MQITDHLLVLGAKLHNQYVARMPQLLYQHSYFRDEAGDGLTGLGFDVEAAALGLQVRKLVELGCSRQTQTQPRALHNSALWRQCAVMYGSDR